MLRRRPGAASVRRVAHPVTVWLLSIATSILMPIGCGVDYGESGGVVLRMLRVSVTRGGLMKVGAMAPVRLIRICWLRVLKL